MLEDIAFVIMRFGDEQLDSTYHLVIRQVLLDFGYSPLRIDEVQDSGRINGSNTFFDIDRKDRYS